MDFSKYNGKNVFVEFKSGFFAVGLFTVINEKYFTVGDGDGWQSFNEILTIRET